MFQSRCSRRRGILLRACAFLFFSYSCFSASLFSLSYSFSMFTTSVSDVGRARTTSVSDVGRARSTSHASKPSRTWFAGANLLYRLRLARKVRPSNSQRLPLSEPKRVASLAGRLGPYVLWLAAFCLFDMAAVSYSYLSVESPSRSLRSIINLNELFAPSDDRRAPASSATDSSASTNRRR